MRPPSAGAYARRSCFNSRTLGRVRQDGTYLPSDLTDVSIHAPWEGCDHNDAKLAPRTERFNSRTLGRVRLRARSSWGWTSAVSIHAPWEGCDGLEWMPQTSKPEFQFTHPGKGATRYRYGATAPLCGFNSRTLGRVRHATKIHKNVLLSFNSRTLGRVRRSLSESCIRSVLFQFTHPGKGATCEGVRPPSSVMFQFTHPGKGAT